MEPKEFTRYVAYKVPIVFVKNSDFMKEEATSYIPKDNKKVFRINVIGVVISKNQSGNGINSLVIDDGSENINVRGFDNNSIPNNLQIGDIINVIGRPREYGSEKYIAPEIVKKSSKEWMILRNKENESGFKTEMTSNKEDNEEEEVKQEIQNKDNIPKQELIIKLIKEEDSGQGIEIEKIMDRIDGAERIIEVMLKEGELFENLPGKVKVLE